MASAATSTTLPLFWHLSSNKKDERLDASSRLISALSEFQASHAVDVEEQPDVDVEDYEVQNARLDSLNAADVAYAIRRLIRGLASPRESSRLGFAVALTELLSRLDTVTCQQIITIVKNASQTSGGMSGQEERDMLFARLFGFKAIIESGLLVREQPLRSSSIQSSTLESFDSITVELVALGNKKSWLKETSWWTILSAVNTLAASEATWKNEALTNTVDKLFVQDKTWSAEKIALGLKLQGYVPSKNWVEIFGPYFKAGDLLSSGNLVQLARILKESDEESENSEAPKISHSGPWKAQLHFVWNVILDVLLANDASSSGVTSGNLQDFYRVVVDENLFASSSTPNRKYWGFQVFQKILHRLPPSSLHVLFTPNFMRTWINHLSKADRYLHKAAKQVAVNVQTFVEKEPTAGFALVLQLMGTNGSQNFDRITRTKTVESILAKMDSKGTDEYMKYLLEQFNKDETTDAFETVDARRKWVIEQLSTLLKRCLVSKNEDCVSKILMWLATNSFFIVSKKSAKSINPALHEVPSPPLSTDLHVLCRNKLLICIAELATVSFTTEKGEETKSSRSLGLTSSGELWVTKALKMISDLTDDKKHVSIVEGMDDRLEEVKRDVLNAINQLKKSSGDRLTLQRGAEFLIVGLALFCLCEGEDDEDKQALTDAIDVSLKEFGSTKAPKKKKENDGDADRAPIDILVDIIIGLLENSTNYKRTIANQSFTMLSALVADSTVDLILAQLQRRDPTQEVDLVDSEDVSADEDAESSQDEEESEDEEDEEEDDNESEDEDEDEDEDATEALREKLEALVPELDGDDSDEASMDDDQMMEIDEKLAEVFRSRVEERKKNKNGAQREATYFKNRVLDLVDIYLKREPTNPLVLRFVLPIVELVSRASNDERQLAEKAAGIIRSRFSKPKEAPLISEETVAVEILQKLHENARKAHSPETLSCINICSLFVLKALSRQWSQHGEKIYEGSIADFASRKGSSLNTAFFLEFIRRCPVLAWHIRKSFLESSKKAINGFRQSQLFSCVQVLVTTVIGLPDDEIKREDIVYFVKTALETLQGNLSSACATDKVFLTAAQMKESLKSGVHLAQSAKRVATSSENTVVTSTSLNAKVWDELRQKLVESVHYKTSPSLQGLCKQIFHIIQSWNKEVAGSKPSRKRKGEVADDPESQIVAKAKRKKVRKTREDQ